MSDSLVAICGRGKSLLRFKEHNWDKVYCVNDMAFEFSQIPIRSSYKLTHVAGRKGSTAMPGLTLPRRTVINALDKEHHDNIKRFCDIKVEYRPDYMLNRGYPPISWRKILKGVTKAAIQSDNGNCWPTTGLFAIDLACMENNPCELHLFGFDFYRQPYLVKDNRPHQTQHNPKIKCMYLYLQKLIDEFTNINFFCYSQLGLKGKNWSEV